MGLFDIFSNSDANAAAAAQTAGINSGYSSLTDLYNQANAALTGAYQPAVNSLTGNNQAGTDVLSAYYNQGAGALSQGYNAGIGSLNSGYGAGLSSLYGAYGQGAGALGSSYTAGLAPYLWNYNSSQGGVNQLGNLLGLNGASGNASALSTLENTPGYQFQLQQGDNAINAYQAATGELASGNTMVDLSNYNQGLAGTTYQNAVNNVQPYLNYSTSGAGGVLSGYSGLGTGLSNIYTGLGNTSSGLFSNLGTATAGMQAGLGSGISNIYTGLGNTTNTNYQNLGTNLANTYTGLGNQQANLYQTQGNAAYGADTSAGNAQANADLANLSASSNIWNGLMSGAGLAALGFGLSDERAKDDVEEVGKLHSGEPVVRFKYKDDPTNRHQIGLIAQHVEKVTPDAVREFHTDIRPMKYVDYKRATDLAAGLAKFLKQAA